MVFVLGIERSATTWVSNILDMHSGTELYMEPLSANISLFENWPPRFVEIENTAERAAYFWDEFARLKKRKRFLLSRFGDSDTAWSVDMSLARKFWQFSPFARDFFELNFHRAGTHGYPAKTKNPVQIIKELRLNYNVPLIRDIDPSAKVVVVLRNYAANVQSIAQHIGRGSLAELAQLLKERYGDLDIHHIFDYWGDSYNRLLSDLDKYNIEHVVVKQEELIQSGRQTLDKLLRFVGLEPEQTVYNYLSESDTSGSGKHSTDRDHAVILNKNRQAEKELYSLLADRIEKNQWHPLLKEQVTKPDQEC